MDKKLKEMIKIAMYVATKIDGYITVPRVIEN